MCEGEYTSGLGHLLSIQHEMPIAAHALGPLVRGTLPDGRVVVQSKAQMVVDQILARSLQLQMISRSLGKRYSTGGWSVGPCHRALTSQDARVMLE